MTKKLLVIVPDRLSNLIQKGEVIDRYYNPGDLFDEVHIMMTNDDKPDPAAVQPLFGRAKLILHNILPPAHYFINTLGWQFSLMQKWTASVLNIARNINPHIVRTHNNFLEGYLASEIKKNLGIPYVTSLHGVWDVDDLTTFKSRVHRFFRKKLERRTLLNADAVICVYSSILDYASRYGAKNPLLIQNFTGGDHIKIKTSYDLSNPIRLITVNRQLPEKNPENIIRALALLPYKFQYMIVGDGIYHEKLQQLSTNLGLGDQIIFVKSMPNSEVCELYSKCDFMISNCHYKGISKTIIEAGLSGLPIILNRYSDGYKLKEYEGDWIEECADTPEGYAEALDKLIEDHKARETIGKKAFSITHQQFSPKILEDNVAAIYNRFRRL